MPITFKTVPDTNVILATSSENPKSPNREYYERWLYSQEFDLLYSDDTLHEYIEKLEARGDSEETIIQFLRAILKIGVKVEIEFFHLKSYPADPDDIAFVICAENGNASHLISYDRHILDLKYQHKFGFKICKIIEFLQELRANQSSISSAGGRINE
jgi:uncharacterized protein